MTYWELVAKNTIQAIMTISTKKVTPEIISPVTANVLGFLPIPIIDNINPVSHMIRFTIGSNTRNIATTDVMNPTRPMGLLFRLLSLYCLL